MRLSDFERRIVAAGELEPLLSASVVAKRLGVSTHRVQYALRSMKSNGTIHERPFIDLHLLGILDTAFFFSLASDRAGECQRFIKYLVAHPKVSTVHAYAGEFQYKCVLFSRSLAEIETFISDLSDRFPEIIADQFISQRVSYTQYPRKYLQPQRTASRSLSTRVTTEILSLDSRDKEILFGLASGLDDSWRALAQGLKMPHSTVEDRINKMRKLGIIKGFYWDIDLSRLEITPYTILIRSGGISTQKLKAFEEFCAKNSSITYLIRTLGHWDIEVGVEVPRPKDILAVVQALQQQIREHCPTVSVLHEIELEKFTMFPSAGVL